MTNTLMNYTSRSQVENFNKRVFSEVTDTEFNSYLKATEAYINNYCGYNAETTTSGMMAEAIVREKVDGKIDSFGNLVATIMKPPINFDSNNNPLVTLLEYNLGGVRIPLQLTDGTANSLNTLLEVSENRKKIVYPSLYFFPAISSVTPTAKVNLYNLRDVKFYVDVSYVGGYNVLPSDVTLAANYICSQYLLNRDNPNHAISVKQGSYAIQYLETSSRFVKGQPVNQFLAIANDILQPYVRYTW